MSRLNLKTFLPLEIILIQFIILSSKKFYAASSNGINVGGLQSVMFEIFSQLQKKENFQFKSY